MRMSLGGYLPRKSCFLTQVSINEDRGVGVSYDKQLYHDVFRFARAGHSISYSGFEMMRKVHKLTLLYQSAQAGTAGFGSGPRGNYQPNCPKPTS